MKTEICHQKVRSVKFLATFFFSVFYFARILHTQNAQHSLGDCVSLNVWLKHEAHATDDQRRNAQISDRKLFRFVANLRVDCLLWYLILWCFYHTNWETRFSNTGPGKMLGAIGWEIKTQCNVRCE